MKRKTYTYGIYDYTELTKRNIFCEDDFIGMYDTIEKAMSYLFDLYKKGVIVRFELPYKSRTETYSDIKSGNKVVMTTIGGWQ